jgi:ADP-heptose:LPS heptosyltransferase
VKILLAKRRALGDTVLLSSAVAQLKRALPGAEVSVLVPAAFAPVLEGNPEIRRIFLYEEGWWKLLPGLRREGFDYFLQLHASPGNRWLGWGAGAKRAFFHFQNGETEKAYGKHPNALEWDGFFFRSLFGGEISLPAPPPRIYLAPAEKESSYWSPVGPKRVVMLGLGASRPTKRWLPRHFARFALLLRERKDLHPAVVVGPGEEEALFAGAVIDEMRALGLRAIQGGKGDFFHLAGLSVRDLARALHGIRAYVGNDSGPKHMAAALGVPTVTLFGPEDPVEWHPYDLAAHPVFFIPNLDCRREDNGRWCGISVCEESGPERHRCMRDIDPLDVFAMLTREENTRLP